MKRLIFAAAVLLCSVSVGSAQVDAAFKAGEKLTFSLSHSYVKANIIGIVFQTTSTNVNGKPAYRVEATGNTLTGYRTFFDLNDIYRTWLDMGTLRPVKYQSRLKEGKYRFEADYTYNWSNNTVATSYRKLSKPQKTNKSLRLEAGAGDAIALFYNLRSSNISSLKVGERHTMKLVLDDTVRTLSFRYMGREEKKIGRLGRFKTLKIICSMASSTDPDAQVFADGSEFSLWLSDDRNHMPLYIESPIKVGSIVAALTKYEGLKYPLDSKLK